MASLVPEPGMGPSVGMGTGPSVIFGPGPVTVTEVVDVSIPLAGAVPLPCKVMTECSVTVECTVTTDFQESVVLNGLAEAVHGGRIEVVPFRGLAGAVADGPTGQAGSFVSPNAAVQT